MKRQTIDLELYRLVASAAIASHALSTGRAERTERQAVVTTAARSPFAAAALDLWPIIRD